MLQSHGPRCIQDFAQVPLSIESISTSISRATSSRSDRLYPRRQSSIGSPSGATRTSFTTVLGVSPMSSKRRRNSPPPLTRTIRAHCPIRRSLRTNANSPLPSSGCFRCHSNVLRKSYHENHHSFEMMTHSVHDGCDKIEI